MTPHRCWAEVDLAALRGNLAWIRHRVGKDVKVVTVVKADAYGHGLKQIAALLMQGGTDIFGVANLTEAQAIRSVGRGWPVLMLGACFPEEIETAVRDDVMPTISSLAEAKAFNSAAAQQRKFSLIHVKVDTGMGRLGVAPEAASALLAQIAGLSNLHVSGLYTHYSSAEDSAEFSTSQRKKFEGIVSDLRAKHLLPPLIHANNSAALLHEPRSIYNVVRPGLLVYGIAPPGTRRSASALQKHLHAALSLKCRVSFVKEIPKGTPLSYGRTFVASKKMRVATLGAGYGDGYPRAGSNRAEVLIGGKRCRVLGRVTMDQTLVDVSALRDVNAGEEAVLIGKQGRDEITVTELASWCDTVPWEILTNITSRVPRVYRGGHAA
ncbi:MAG TPA: alanine racemase [Candidatus Limnocylindria bacterium]|nr:alanine racemase [Candidatus Limnocylindria bacterium]